MEAQIGQRAVRQRVEVARHDGEMRLARRIDEREGRVMAPEEIQCFREVFIFRPMAIAQLHHRA